MLEVARRMRQLPRGLKSKLKADGLSWLATGYKAKRLFFLFFFGYREDVYSMQAETPAKIPDKPILSETPASSRRQGDQSTKRVCAYHQPQSD